MKPAWHEVVASLETAVTRTSSATSRAAAACVPRVSWGDAPVAPASDRGNGVSPRTRLIESFARGLQSGTEFAVAVLDLDGFKAFNLSHGNEQGDRALAIVASRLRDALEMGEDMARFGSDEFAVRLRVADPEAAAAAGARLLAAIAPVIDLPGGAVMPTASIGVAIASPRHARVEDLLREADRALDRARVQGGGRCVVFEPAANGRPLALSGLETALRRALDNEEFREHFQPIVSIKGGQVAGFEVLLWRKSGANHRRA